jgi:hypothetical protein
MELDLCVIGEFDLVSKCESCTVLHDLILFLESIL